MNSCPNVFTNSGAQRGVPPLLGGPLFTSSPARRGRGPSETVFSRVSVGRRGTNVATGALSPEPPNSGCGSPLSPPVQTHSQLGEAGSRLGAHGSPPSWWGDFLTTGAPRADPRAVPSVPATRFRENRRLKSQHAPLAPKRLRVGRRRTAGAPWAALPPGQNAESPCGFVTLPECLL